MRILVSSFFILRSGYKRESSELIHESLKVTPLGAGNEVGRSCILLEYKGKKIMLDCGIHPAHTGIAALPYFDEINPASLDAILISHFHLDHAAALPYYLSKTNFKGRVFMTHPTKSIYRLILQDYVRVSSLNNPDSLYDEIDLINSIDRIEGINFHQVVNLNGIKFWAYNAGHVLGAAMFMIEIAGVKILYTGDYSRKDDRHLTGAEIPEMKPDVLIIESTYGIQKLDPMEKREKQFTDLVHNILKRGGRCLIPVFALGRAQELLLILDEYWKQNPSLQSYPIYYASSLAQKCISVYKTYINMMNTRIQKQFKDKNPFDFEFIRYLDGIDSFHDVGPSVVFASPGMLQSGLSRQLFEEWCGDKKNGVIIPGYVVDGTLAKTIIMEPEKVESMSGEQLAMELSVHYVTFSAHADFTQTSDFVKILNPPHIILVHGDSNEMSRLRNALTIQVKEKKTQITSPKNCQTITLEFGTEKVAKVVGKIAKIAPEEGKELNCLMVAKEYDMNLMSKDDLKNYTSIINNTIHHQIKVPFSYSKECLLALINQIFDIEESVDENQGKDFSIFSIGNIVKVLHNLKNAFVILEWTSSNTADIIADSVMAIIASAESMPGTAIAKLVMNSKNNPKNENELKNKKIESLNKVLKAFFDKKYKKFENNSKNLFQIEIEKEIIQINSDFKIEGKDKEKVDFVQNIVNNCLNSLKNVDLSRSIK